MNTNWNFSRCPLTDFKSLFGLVLYVWGIAGHIGAAEGPRENAVRGGAVLVNQTFQVQQTSKPIKGFTAYGGAWHTANGEVWSAPGPGPKLVLDTPELSSGQAGVDVFLPDRSAGNAALIIHVSRPGIGADAFHGYEIALDASAQVLRLGKHRQNFQLLRDVPCAVPIKEWIPIEVRWQQNTLEVFVSGRMLARHEDKDNPLPAGRIGVRPWVGNARFRQLWFKTNDVLNKITFENGAEEQESGIAASWKAFRQGTVLANYSVEPGGPHQAREHQKITYQSGVGAVGLYHDAEGGMNFQTGRIYQGFLWARSEQPVELVVALDTKDGRALAEKTLKISPGPWSLHSFTMLPSRGAASGSLVVKLNKPGTVQLGRAYLEAGDWGWPESLGLKNLPPLLFLKRRMLSEPPVVGCDLWAARPTGPGCAICIWDPEKLESEPVTVFKDDTGCIYDMNLSLDGKTIFFSYARAAEKHWHLWRIGVDGRGLRQLTDGPYYDVSPCEIPDGSLVFVSTRRFGHTVCQPGPASNLYRLPGEGGSPQCISMNTLSDTTPQLLPDGRVLFMRWEYIDRDLTFRQSLWTQNPDGTGYQLFFGNTVRDPGTFWQARPVPGRNDRVLATFASHHGYPHGAIGWVERNHGPETRRGVGFDWITQEFPSIGDVSHLWAYRDPFPLDEQSFLCAYGGGGEQRFRLYLHDVHDRKRLLYDDPQMHCFFPMPLRPTAAPPMLSARSSGKSSVQPDLPEEHSDTAQPMGTCILVDVYQGLEPAVKRGQVKFIRVMEQIRKTEDIPVIPHVVDFGPRAYDQSPLMSYATYYAKRCWGMVPVEEDGSAHFQVPALREVYFQACDADGRELQRMTSGAQLMPGETVSCVGCHEPRTSAPARIGKMPKAALREASSLKKFDWAPDGVIDFVRVVQPVLDKYCVECHAGGKTDGGYDLSGDKTRFFNMAYDNLLGRSRSYRQHNMDTGEMLPEEQAKGKPLVHFYWLLRTPTAVNLPLSSGSPASRLPEYLDARHTKKEMSSEDRLKIYTWIDADVPYYGTYDTTRRKCGGKRDLCQDPETAKPYPWFAQDFMPVYTRRCAPCHGEFPQTSLVTCWDGRTAWINFSRPEFSPALTAHLSKSQGGRGIQAQSSGKNVPLIQSTEDADYQILLKAFQAAKKLAEQIPGPDMPGFIVRRKEP